MDMGGDRVSQSCKTKMRETLVTSLWTSRAVTPPRASSHLAVGRPMAVEWCRLSGLLDCLRLLLHRHFMGQHLDGIRDGGC